MFPQSQNRWTVPLTFLLLASGAVAVTLHPLPIRTNRMAPSPSGLPHATFSYSTNTTPLPSQPSSDVPTKLDAWKAVKKLVTPHVIFGPCRWPDYSEEFVDDLGNGRFQIHGYFVGCIQCSSEHSTDEFGHVSIEGTMQYEGAGQWALNIKPF